MHVADELAGGVTTGQSDLDADSIDTPNPPILLDLSSIREWQEQRGQMPPRGRQNLSPEPPERVPSRNPPRGARPARERSLGPNPRLLSKSPSSLAPSSSDVRTPTSPPPSARLAHSANCSPSIEARIAKFSEAVAASTHATDGGFHTSRATYSAGSRSPRTKRSGEQFSDVEGGVRQKVEEIELRTLKSLRSSENVQLLLTQRSMRSEADAEKRRKKREEKESLKRRRRSMKRSADTSPKAGWDHSGVPIARRPTSRRASTGAMSSQGRSSPNKRNLVAGLSPGRRAQFEATRLLFESRSAEPCPSGHRFKPSSSSEDGPKRRRRAKPQENYPIGGPVLRRSSDGAIYEKSLIDSQDSDHSDLLGPSRSLSSPSFAICSTQSSSDTDSLSSFDSQFPEDDSLTGSDPSQQRRKSVVFDLVPSQFPSLDSSLENSVETLDGTDNPLSPIADRSETVPPPASRSYDMDGQSQTLDDPISEDDGGVVAEIKEIIEYAKASVVSKLVRHVKEVEVSLGVHPHFHDCAQLGLIRPFRDALTELAEHSQKVSNRRKKNALKPTDEDKLTELKAVSLTTVDIFSIRFPIFFEYYEVLLLKKNEQKRKRTNASGKPVLPRMLNSMVKTGGKKLKKLENSVIAAAAWRPDSPRRNSPRPESPRSGTSKEVANK